MSKHGLMKFGAVVGAIAATVAGTAIIANRSADQREEALFREHPENTGFGLPELPTLPEQPAVPTDAETRIAAAEKAAAEARAAAEKAEAELARVNAEKEAERIAREEARAAVAARQARRRDLAEDFEDGTVGEPDIIVTEKAATDRVYRRPLSRTPIVTEDVQIGNVMSAEKEAPVVDATVIAPAVKKAMVQETPDVEPLPPVTEAPEPEKLSARDRRRKAKEEKAAEKIRLAEEKAAEEARIAEEKAKAAEEARLKAEAEAKARAEEEARLAEEARLKAEAEAKARAEEEARLAREARLKAEAEAKAKEEAEAKEKAAEEARIAEKARLAVAAKLAEEERLAEEARLMEEALDDDEERIVIYMDPNLSTIEVGRAVVSDDPENEFIAAVAKTAGVAPEKLVSLDAEDSTPLVFEFLSADERNEVTLQNVYFISEDGKVTLPSRKDHDNILAFGKAFITDVYGFKAFLDRK